MKDIKEFLTESKKPMKKHVNPMKKHVKTAEQSKIGGEDMKKYYHKIFPTDSIWKELRDGITLAEVFRHFADGEDIYAIIDCDDSLVRERMFGFFCAMTGLKYDEIYDYWFEQ